jgi:hypothetical protein
LFEVLEFFEVLWENVTVSKEKGGFPKTETTDENNYKALLMRST